MSECNVNAVPAKNIVTQDGQTLNLTKIKNARQLNGYVNIYGKRVVKDKILRTGHLAKATPEDVQKLLDYGLNLVIDFRSTGEVTRAPDVEIPGITRKHIKILDESYSNKFHQMANGSFTNPGEYMVQMYESGMLNEKMYLGMLEDPTVQKGFTEFLKLLAQQEKGTTILYHCSSGKDRVGTATALLLSILEVDRETILDDFDLTNVFETNAIASIRAKSKQYTDDPKAIEGIGMLAGVVRFHMELALNHLDEKYGSPIKYIQDVLGITDQEIEAMRNNFLE